MQDGSILERHNRALVRLARNKALNGDNLDAGLELITQTVADELGVQRAGIWRLDTERDELVCLKLREADRFTDGQVLTSSEYPNYFAALKEGRYVSATDARSDPRTAEFLENYLEPFGIHAMLDATIRQHGKLAGVVCCEFQPEPRDWTVEEELFAGAIADLTASFLSHVQSRQIRHELDDSRERYRRLFDSSQDALLILRDGRIVEFNPAASDLLRCQELHQAEFTSRVLPGPEMSEAGENLDDHVKLAAAGQSGRHECRLVRDGGEVLDVEMSLGPIQTGSEALVLATLRDITSRKRQEALILHQAYHDTLTDLPNRNHLGKHLEDLIEASKFGGKRLALLLVDLDRFKEINDSLGHETGDRLLQAIGPLLDPVLRPYSAYLARPGGDEFVILIPGIEDAESVEEIAKEVAARLAEPVEVGELHIEIGSSIGISVCPDHGSDLNALMRTAEIAMYQAKAGISRVRTYSPQIDNFSADRLHLMMDLRRALRNEEMFLVYQKKVRLEDQELDSYEALVRWNHPERGILPPGQFVDLAEMSDVIAPLTDNVLRSAVEQISLWEEVGHSKPIAINISVRNLLDTEFPRSVASLIETRRIDPKLLEFEITESSVMQDAARCLQSLRSLADIGIDLSIDDFGTGYSSMAYLRQLPVQGLKIDLSFTQRMLESEQDAMIVRTIIDLAHNLGLKVVAEGIDNQDAVNELVEMGCDLGQGYFFGKPAEADRVIQTA